MNQTSDLTSTPNSQSVDSTSKIDSSALGSKLNVAPTLRLNSGQERLILSILDLYAGKSSEEALSLWKDDAEFVDPLTHAYGRKEYASQWYGLPKVFDPIEIQHYQVKSLGKPILMDLTNKYTLRGVGKEVVLNSTVAIHVDEKSGLIEKVEDRWNGKELSEGPVREAFKRLSAKTVPLFVNLPPTQNKSGTT